MVDDNDKHKTKKKKMYEKIENDIEKRSSIPSSETCSHMLNINSSIIWRFQFSAGTYNTYIEMKTQKK